MSSLAQLAERGPSKTKAGGSIPSGAIFDFISFFVRLYFGVVIVVFFEPDLPFKTVV